jgi:NAD(P)-dependent dehydrogenase (short-subunit alcohol dehydrogenase family)
VNNFTRALSHAYGADNILVNAVAAGLIASEGLEGQLMAGARARGVTLDEAKASFLRKVKPNTVGRLGTVEEVGAFVAFLCSEAAGFMTGSVYRIESGTIGAAP